MDTDENQGTRVPENATAEASDGNTRTGVEAEPSENPGAVPTGKADEADGSIDPELDEEEDEEGHDDDEDDEEEQDLDNFSVRVDVGELKGEKNVAAGQYIQKQINTVPKNREDEPVVAKLGKSTIARLRGVFARPDGYEKFIEKENGEHRIIAVNGPERSGKLTCAVNLACDLWGEEERPPKIYLYKRDIDETRSLGEAIQSKSVKREAVVILEDVFEKNVPRHELELPELSDLEEVLEKKEAFLLVTTRAEDSGSFMLPRLNARVRDLKRVLRAQLDYLRKQENWALGDELVNRVLAKWSALKSTLHNPAQIERFCRRLAEQAPQNPEEIERLAEQAAVAGRKALQEWFGGLRSNEKLLAMLIYLFGGEREFLEEIYRKSVRDLRAAGLVWLDDPREMGFGDMLEAVEVRDLGGLVEFKDAEFEEEAAAQVENWSHLIWSVLDPLVKDLRPGEEWDSWQPRRGLGNALGRMSLHGRKSFIAAVDRLAGQDWREAAVVAGYALEETVRRDFDAQRKPVLEKLLSWIDSGNPSLMWAAGASLARVYAATAGRDTSEAATSAFQNHLINLLRRLIEKDRANWKCAWGTARRIFLLDSGRTSILGVWLHDEKESVRKVARKSITLIFEVLAKARYKPGEAKHRPFLDLVEPVLAAAGRGENDRLLVDQTFLTIKGWLRWPGWYAPLFQVLLGVANSGSSSVREKLRAALSRLWLHREAGLEAESAFKIAQAVIARAYAMDGVLMDRPRFGQCVFVIDPAFLNGDEEVQDCKEKVYRHLVGLLEAQVDVSVVHLGSSDAVRLGEDHSALPMAMDHPVPPLVMPALEAASRGETRLILVLTTRCLWDLDDVVSRPWAKDFFLVASGDGIGECEGIETIPIGEDPKPEEVAKVEKALQVHWARALAKAGACEWRGVLQSFGLGAEIEEGPRAWLNRMVAGLADIGGATGHGDLARQILCVVGWYASRNLQTCARLLRSWLEEPMENEAAPCRRWMGAAGARALFSIHSAETPSFEDSAPEILFEELAAPLAVQGRDGSEAVLRAVWQWIEEPVWAWYLAGDVVEGRGRLLRWAERFAPQHAGELRRLLPEVKPAPLHDGWESTAAMIERIRVRAALGAPKTLPDLAEGERYGVIALDASDLEARKPANLDTVAIEFCRSLNSLNGHGLKPVIYRLGERRPVWVADALPPRDALLAPEAPRQPRLLGPILMDPGLSPDRVKFVLVLSVQPLLDAEDWLETEWRERIVFLHPGAGPERHPGFAALPVLVGKSAGLSIARFLLHSSAGEGPASAAA